MAHFLHKHRRQRHPRTSVRPWTSVRLQTQGAKRLTKFALIITQGFNPGINNPGEPVTTLGYKTTTMTHTLHITALTILLSLSASLHAQSPDVLRGKEILEQVSRKTKAYTSIKADFSFTLDNKQAQITDTHKGNILIKGDKYKAEIMGAETYFDGQNTYMYMTDINEVNISGPEMLDEEDSLNPATIFSIFEQDR